MVKSMCLHSAKRMETGNETVRWTEKDLYSDSVMPTVKRMHFERSKLMVR